METLGKINNNPMNIRYNSLNRWLGLQGSYKGFCVFSCVDYGLRAGIITLRTYINKHGLTSVEKIIKRFAPASENDTYSYIHFVSSCIRSNGYDPDHIVYKSDAFLILVHAICIYESRMNIPLYRITNIINRFNL